MPVIQSQIFQKNYPFLAKFGSPDTYTRRSKLGRISLVRKHRWGDSTSRRLARKIKLKRNIRTLANTGRISGSANPNLLTLQLKNISNRGTRKAYAKLVKQAAKGLGKVF